MSDPSASLTVVLTEGLVDAMASVSGDASSIHMNEEFARLTRYRERVVHGMLPVALAYLLARRMSTKNAAAWLARINCGFKEPLRLGDRAILSVSAGGGDDIFDFEIRNATDARVATAGKFEFSGVAGDIEPDEAVAIFPSQLEEAVRFPEEMKRGTEDTLAFEACRISASALVGSMRESDRTALLGVSLDRNFAATLAVSTLVGMRLPGRFATFTELIGQFDRELSAGRRVILRGGVDSPPSTTSRAKIAIAWSQDGVELGKGSATTLVNPVRRTIIPMTSVRADASMGIEGKTALVTGASRGIGEATAKILAVLGAKVVVHYFKGQADARAVVAEINAAGGRALAVQADLGQIDDIDRMFDVVAAELGGVDILVNNAVSRFSPKEIASLASTEFEGELAVSLRGMHECCRRVIPHMTSQRWGKIVNISSIATQSPVSGQGVYIAVKAAMEGYTRTLSVELAAHNVQANCVLPRMTDTSLIAGIPSVLIDRLADESVAGRLLKPIEVARVVAFLASDWSNPVSGQRLVLNQGEMPYL